MHIYGILAATVVAAASQFIHHELRSLDKLQTRIVQKKLCSYKNLVKKNIVTLGSIAMLSLNFTWSGYSNKIS